MVLRGSTGRTRFTLPLRCREPSSASAWKISSINSGLPSLGRDSAEEMLSNACVN
jgi:hypothetical protein